MLDEKVPSLAAPQRSNDQILPLGAYRKEQPSIYIQEFWNTLTYVEKAGTYRFQLDEDWFTLDANFLKEALEITPIDQAHPFVSPPLGDAIMDFVNELGYPECLTNMTSDHDRPIYLVLQMLWGIITSTNVDYAELMWEEFVQAMQTLLTDKANLGSPPKKGRKDKPHEAYYLLGNLKFVSKGEIDEVFGMPIPNELISNNIKIAPYYNAYLEMVAKHDQKVAAKKEGKKNYASTKQPKPKPTIEKSSKPAPAPKLKLVDEPDEEPAHFEPEPEAEHQREGEEFEMECAIQMSLESRTPATEEASTGPSAQPQDNTSANIVCDSPSLTDVETGAGSDKTNSGGDTELLQINEELGEDVEKQMDDPNMTMDEYIKLEEEKSRRRAIVIDDAFTPQDALPCKSQVSTPVNDEIDFRISFDESDDKDYTIICNKNSFSYKMISVNNLKTDSENDNEKAGIPSFPPPKPTTSYIDDLDFVNDFENEFPAICLNMMKRNKIFCTLMIYSPFNIIRPDGLKSEKDNNDNDIDIIQSSEDMAPLPPHDQRHPFLRYQGLEYTDADIADFEERLERIYSREIHRLRDDSGVVVFTSRAWGRLFDTRGPLVRELILEFLSTLRFGEEMESPGFARYWSESERMVLGKGDLHDYWRDILTDGDFLGPPRSYTLIRDPMLRLCHRMMAHSIAGRSQAPEKSEDHISGGQFVARLAEHFRLLTAKILGGLSVISPELLIIDMGKLVRLQICMEVDDTWAWVAMGLESQPDATAGVPVVDEDAPAADEGDQAVLTPVQAPQQPPPPPPAAARTMPQRLGRLEEEVQGLRRDVRSLRGLVERSMIDQGIFSTWTMSCMTQLMDASRLTYQAFDGSHAAFQRRTRQRTGEASTSAAQQDPQQPDP
ncbi:hypothetical protein Tco_0856938 [Tanacetum coccineum]|uniref:Uncharacterized protein n=1 Tax=Tanacetum coccineum TaxID=301880 RepID=A0ABQ5B5J1_9ASTR